MEPRPSPSSDSGSDTLVDESGGSAAQADRKLVPGSSLGRYLIIDKLGAGGMGVVYAAYDPQLDRKVAIKLLYVEYDERRSTEGRARLVREAKALAQLSHPNVVTVHEVGTEQGRVYLVMEHVDGRTLGQWLEQGPRTRAEILEAFHAAGQGLAAAHAKGLVHRDFKPDNVMIGTQGRVRVMDFGLARTPVADSEVGSVDDEVELGSALVRPSGDLSAPLTRGSSLVGTPAYMAPEQWRRRPVDARTDQYSFCVTLYEALYGQRPFAGSAPGVLMMAVVQGEIEPAPSGTRVPAWLRRVLLRGLHRDPEQRYPSMDALLQALQDDPTTRRRRWIVGFAAVGLALGALGVQQVVAARHQTECQAQGAAIAEVWDDQARARLREALTTHAGPIGTATAQRVEPFLDDYAQRWAQARTEVCTAPPPGAVGPEPLLDRAIACLDERRDALANFVQLVVEGDSGSFERAVRVASQLPTLQACTDLSALQRRPAVPADRAKRERLAELRVQLRRVSLRAQLDPGPDASEAVRAVLREAEQLHWMPLLAEAGYALGQALVVDGELAAAEPVYADAYFAAAEVSALDLALAIAERQTFVVGTGLHRPEEAELWSRLAGLALASLEVPEQDLRYARDLDARAGLAFARGEFEIALALHERELEIREALLGPEHPSLATTLESIANCRSGLGDGQGALEVLERALAIEQRVLGPDHPEVAWTLMDLSLAHGVEQRYDQSHGLAEQALAIRERVYGPDHRFVAHSLDFMCAADADRGRLDRADQECARALRINEAQLGRQHPETGWSHYNIGLIAQGRGQLEEARRQWEMALAVLEPALGAEHPRTMITRSSLAQLDGGGGEGGHGLGAHGHGEHVPPEH
ncbi:MAG: serine/threonine-protein kinase [Nannocystaceae bacterium]